MAFTHYRTKGIFLSAEEKGEADRLFTIFSADYGKIEVVGKAIRKVKSKLRGGADIFYLSEIEFIQGKNQKILTDALGEEKFKNLRREEERMEAAWKMAAALRSLAPKEEKDERIWALLQECLRELNPPSLALSPALLYYYFLWKLFFFLGYQPELQSCVVCGRRLLPETFWFFPAEGGIVCWRCLEEKKKEAVAAGKGKIEEEGEEIGVDTVKVLRLLRDGDLSLWKRIKIGKETEKNLGRISQKYLRFLEDQLSSSLPKEEV